MIEEAFKFHYVSINSSGRSTPYVYWLDFKFHYVSINSDEDEEERKEFEAL